MRIKSIDFYKGLLMLLVIVGYFFIDLVKEHPVKYFISLFHIPISISISACVKEKQVKDWSEASLMVSATCLILHKLDFRSGNAVAEVVKKLLLLLAAFMCLFHYPSL